jgi:hypothetical protein
MPQLLLGIFLTQPFLLRHPSLPMATSFFTALPAKGQRPLRSLSLYNKKPEQLHSEKEGI